MKIHKRLRAVVSQTTSRYLLEHIALEDVRPTTNTGGGNPAGNGSAQQQTGTVPEGAEGATSEANKGVDVELREAYKSYQVSYISRKECVGRKNPRLAGGGKHWENVRLDSKPLGGAGAQRAPCDFNVQ